MCDCLDLHLVTTSGDDESMRAALARVTIRYRPSPSSYTPSPGNLLGSLEQALEEYIAKRSREIRAKTGLSFSEIERNVTSGFPFNFQNFDIIFPSTVAHQQGSGKSNSFVVLANHLAQKAQVIRARELPEEANETAGEFEFYVAEAIRSLEVLEPRFERLITLGQRAASSQSVKSALAAKARRLQSYARSVETPGHLVSSSRRPPRGPNDSRTTSVLVMRGKAITLP